MRVMGYIFTTLLALIVLLFMMAMCVPSSDTNYSGSSYPSSSTSRGCDATDRAEFKQLMRAAATIVVNDENLPYAMAKRIQELRGRCGAP